MVDFFAAIGVLIMLLITVPVGFVAIAIGVDALLKRRRRKRADKLAAQRALPDYPRAEITVLANGSYKVQVVLDKSGNVRGEWYEAITFKGAKRNAKSQMRAERRELALTTQKPVIIR